MTKDWLRLRGRATSGSSLGKFRLYDEHAELALKCCGACRDLQGHWSELGGHAGKLATLRAWLGSALARYDQASETFVDVVQCVHG